MNASAQDPEPGPSPSKLFKKSKESSSTEEDDSNDNDTPSVLVTPTFVHQYQAVKHLMEHLNLRDVLNASQVSKEWQKVGQIVRKQRRNCPFVMLWHPYMPEHNLAFEYFNNLEVSTEATELVESGTNGFPPYRPRSGSRNKFPGYCPPNEVRIATKRDFLSAYDEAQLLICFGTSAMDTYLQFDVNGPFVSVKIPSRHSHRVMLSPGCEFSKARNSRKMDVVYGKMLSSIPCLASSSGGLVATIPGTDNIKSLELERGKLPCLASLVVPKVPGLNVKTFMISKEMTVSRNCRELLGIPEEMEGKLQGIVILRKASHRVSQYLNVIRDYLKKNPKVALAGGMHVSVFHGGVDDESLLAVGMLIFGETDVVRVSSVALQDTGITPKNRGKVEKLKQSLFPDGKSFALMFACNGRGHEMHGRLNAESDLFNTLLPKTPLVGAFTLGEFCHEVIRPLKENEEVQPPTRIDYAYTTVFLMVAYKFPPKPNEGPAKK